VSVTGTGTGTETDDNTLARKFPKINTQKSRPCNQAAKYTPDQTSLIRFSEVICPGEPIAVNWERFHL
jgi:hypothetical protein